MNPPAQKTAIAQLSSLPAECPVAFVEGIILKVFNRRTGINPNPPNAPFAFQEVQLGEVDNPTITFPCQFAGVEFPEITKAHIGAKLQFVCANHNGKPTGVKIKADRVKPVPGQPQQYRNVLHITPTAAVVGLNGVASHAPAPATNPPTPAPAATPRQQAPTPHNLPSTAAPAAAAPAAQKPAAPAAEHVVNDAEMKQDLRHCSRLSKLMAYTAMTIDNGNEAYELITGNQLSPEFVAAMSPTIFLALFKDYGKTSGMDSHMPVCSNADFAEKIKSFRRPAGK